VVKTSVDVVKTSVDVVKTSVDVVKASVDDVKAKQNGALHFRSYLAVIVIADCPDQERQTILDWLSPLDFELTQAKLSHEWQDGSGNWYLKSEQFKAWRDGTPDILWCPGIREPASYNPFLVFHSNLLTLNSGCWKDGPRVWALNAEWCEESDCWHIRSIIIHHLQTFFREKSVAVLFLFCNYKDSTKLNIPILLQAF
jgi:hypothetical protein